MPNYTPPFPLNLLGTAKAGRDSRFERISISGETRNVIDELQYIENLHFQSISILKLSVTSPPRVTRAIQIKCRAPKRLTHFLCIPLVTPASRTQLQKSLQAFCSDVKDDCTPENPNGIPEKAIRPIGTLHLTLGVMSLLTPERVDDALALLRSLDIRGLLNSPITASALAADTKDYIPQAATAAPEPLNITLRGLTTMHAPAKTSILYSSPLDPDGRLYAFCSALRAAFVGFLVAEDRPLLLHATIVNTIYVPGARERGGGAGAGAGAGHGRDRSRMTIDASDVLERYADAVWMEDCRVEKVAICKMGARKCRDADGRETGEEEYVIEGEVDMPVA